MSRVINFTQVNNIIDNITNELVYGGYFVALSGPTYVFIASLLLNAGINIPLLLISYLTPLIIYKFNFYAELSSDEASNPERVAYLKSKQNNYLVTLILLIILLFFTLIILGNTQLMLFMAFLAISGILYTTIFKDFTRFIPLFKDVFVSVMWALEASFLLMFYFYMDLNLFFILFFLFIFLQDVCNVIFFDIKDISDDKEKGLKTLPVLLGKQNTLRLLYLLNGLVFVPILAGIALGVFPLYTLILAGLLLYKVYYLKKAETATDSGLRSLTYTLVEAEFILLAVLLVIGLGVTTVLGFS